MSATPEFVRWALRHDCDLRAETPADDVERVARALFVLRECGRAQQELRVIEGVALEPSACQPATVSSQPLGFRVADVLAAYGGPSAVAPCCRECRVNVVAEMQGDASAAPAFPWAGCFGEVDGTRLAPGGWQELEDRMARVATADEWESAFLPTRPAWYGLWTTAPLTVSQLPLLQRLLDCCLTEIPGAGPILGELATAVRLALRESCPLWVRLFPRGRVEGRAWYVEAHCGRCGAARMEARRPCPVCRATEAPQAARRRAVRGTRPYWPLERLIGASRTAELLARYWQPHGEAR